MRFIVPSLALIGYECQNEGDHSILHFDNGQTCKSTYDISPPTIEEHITIAQLPISKPLKINMCAITVTRSTFYCNWLKFINPRLYKGQLSTTYSLKLSRDECLNMYHNRVFVYMGVTYSVNLEQKTLLTYDSIDLTDGMCHTSQIDFFRDTIAIELRKVEVLMYPGPDGFPRRFNFEGEALSLSEDYTYLSSSDSSLYILTPGILSKCMLVQLYKGSSQQSLTHQSSPVSIVPALGVAFAWNSSVQMCNHLIHSTTDESTFIINGTSFELDVVNSQFVGRYSSYLKASLMYLTNSINQNMNQ